MKKDVTEIFPCYRIEEKFQIEIAKKIIEKLNITITSFGQNSFFQVDIAPKNLTKENNMDKMTLIMSYLEHVIIAYPIRTDIIGTLFFQIVSKGKDFCI